MGQPISVGAGCGLARFRQTLSWSNPGRPGLIWSRRKAAVLLQNRNAFGHAFIKHIAGNAGDKPLQPTFPDQGGRLRSLLFFTLRPHRPKTRHRESEKTGRSVGFQMSLESFLYASCVFGGWRNGDRVRVRISPGCSSRDSSERLLFSRTWALQSFRSRNVCNPAVASLRNRRRRHAPHVP